MYACKHASASHSAPVCCAFSIPFPLLASHSTSSKLLKHRSRWLAGQFRMTVPFSTSGSLQLLRLVLSVSEMKILLAHPHRTPLCHSQHLLEILSPNASLNCPHDRTLTQAALQAIVVFLDLAASLSFDQMRQLHLQSALYMCLAETQKTLSLVPFQPKLFICCNAQWMFVGRGTQVQLSAVPRH